MLKNRMAALLVGASLATGAIISPTVASAQDGTTGPVCETVTVAVPGSKTSPNYPWSHHKPRANQDASEIPDGFVLSWEIWETGEHPTIPGKDEGLANFTVSWGEDMAPGTYTVIVAYDQNRGTGDGTYEDVGKKLPAMEVVVEATTKEICEEPPVVDDGGSGALGSAALGLSALAGSALLSSGGGSSAVPDGDGSGPGSSHWGNDDTEAPAQGPVDTPDSKATGQQPATGPIGGHDPKAVAQAQAANAPAAKAVPAKASPAAQQAAPAPTAQKQLANTGVQGTLTALAAGLAAVAAGAVLVLRRRA